MEDRIKIIEERNIRVEADKRWETSWTRRIAIAILTYLVICLFFFTIEEKQIFLKASIPMIGFVLSTVSLDFLRKITKY